MSDQQQQLPPYMIYLIIISAIGVALVFWGVSQIPSFEPYLIFGLLLVLAMVAEISTSTAAVSEQTSITFDVGTSISMAALPFFGAPGAIVIVAAANFSLWIMKPVKTGIWRKTLPQLSFNNGMHAIAAFVAGSVFVWAQSWFEPASFLQQTIPWLIAAIVYDQMNVWLLVGILRLQHGVKTDMAGILQSQYSATPINVALYSIGGGLLAFAAQQVGPLGIVVFFLPILLSSYAFWLYVRQMQARMEGLEKAVSERTSELETRTQELTALNEEKDVFLAVLTHDMKSPLTSIGLYTELLKQRPFLAEQKPHYLENILRSQATLANIVENILDLENLQVNGEQVLLKRPFALHEAIDYVTESIFVQASEKGLTLETVVCPENPLMLHGDRQQIERVLFNLISNAVKYTPSGGKITVKARNQEAQAEISVADTGYGIPQQDLPHIFEPYRRVAKHKHVAGGTGLGLAVAKAIVNAHGGNIAVESAEGHGSTFTAYLPLD